LPISVRDITPSAPSLIEIPTFSKALTADLLLAKSLQAACMLSPANTCALLTSFSSALAKSPPASFKAFCHWS